LLEQQPLELFLYAVGLWTAFLAAGPQNTQENDDAWCRQLFSSIRQLPGNFHHVLTLAFGEGQVPNWSFPGLSQTIDCALATQSSSDLAEGLGFVVQFVQQFLDVVKWEHIRGLFVACIAPPKSDPVPPKFDLDPRGHTLLYMPAWPHQVPVMPHSYMYPRNSAHPGSADL